MAPTMTRTATVNEVKHDHDGCRSWRLIVIPTMNIASKLKRAAFNKGAKHRRVMPEVCFVVSVFDCRHTMNTFNSNRQREEHHHLTEHIPPTENTTYCLYHALITAIIATGS